MLLGSTLPSSYFPPPSIINDHGWFAMGLSDLHVGQPVHVLSNYCYSVQGPSDSIGSLLVI